MTRLVVVGSANQDYVVRVAQPPEPGQTVLAHGMLRQPGGKGANQAVAAARHGGTVSLVACLGDDDDGAQILKGLREDGVDVSEVEVAAGTPTGIALVQVADTGENSITVVPGANFSLTPERIVGAVGRLAAQDDDAIVVVQGELRADSIAAAVSGAADAGLRCVLNLAPYLALDPALIATCDPLIVNESEAGELLGRPVGDPPSAAAAAREIRRAARSVVITLGARGACWADADGEGSVPAPPVAQVVDTTGAGDALVGALAAALARGASLAEATAVGVAAGSEAVTYVGARPARGSRT